MRPSNIIIRLDDNYSAFVKDREIVSHLVLVGSIVIVVVVVTRFNISEIVCSLPPSVLYEEFQL